MILGLNESELKILNNLISGYLALVENSAIEYRPMYIDDYVKQLGMLLLCESRKLLVGASSVSYKQAIDKAPNQSIENIRKSH